MLLVGESGHHDIDITITTNTTIRLLALEMGASGLVVHWLFTIYLRYTTTYTSAHDGGGGVSILFKYTYNSLFLFFKAKLGFYSRALDTHARMTRYTVTISIFIVDVAVRIKR